MSDKFIRLDIDLINVLGLNRAVIFCHLLGIQTTINEARQKDDAIYQQKNRLHQITKLNTKTIDKCINDLVEMQLLHKIGHTERNKNKYYIDKTNYNYLKQCIKNNNSKQEILNKYYEHIQKSNTKNGTSDDTKNNTTSFLLNAIFLFGFLSTTSFTIFNPKFLTPLYYDYQLS